MQLTRNGPTWLQNILPNGLSCFGFPRNMLLVLLLWSWICWFLYLYDEHAEWGGGWELYQGTEKGKKTKQKSYHANCENKIATLLQLIATLTYRLRDNFLKYPKMSKVNQIFQHVLPYLNPTSSGKKIIGWKTRTRSHINIRLGHDKHEMPGNYELVLLSEHAKVQ